MPTKGTTVSPFSIELGGRSAASLELHEQLTVYFDALRVFIAENADKPKHKITHTDFYYETGITYNYLLTYARDHLDLVEHPERRTGPLRYHVAQASVTPYGAEQIATAVGARENVSIHLARLPGIIDHAISYVQAIATDR